MNKKWNFIAAIAVLLSVAALAIPKIFPVCDAMMETAMGGSTPMRCYYFGRGEMIISILAFIVSMLMFLLKSSGTRILSGVFLLLLGAVVVILPRPWAIGICAKETMDCHTTAMGLSIAGVLIMAVGAAAALLAPRMTAAGKGR